MSKTIKNLAFYAILITMIGLVGCQKDFIDDEVSNEKQTEQTKQKPEVEVIDGILHFRDVETFESILENLGSMTNEERDKWEDEIGFYSLRRVIDDIYDELGEAQSENEFNNILNSNSEIVKIEEDYITEKIPLVFYQTVINKEGLFYTGKTINKVLENEIIRSKDGRLQTINSVINGGITDVLKDVVMKSDLFTEIDATKSTETACGHSESCFLTNASKNRKITGKIYIVNRSYFYARYVSVCVESKSYKKSWGKFRLYKTKHGRKEVAYKTPIPTGDPFIPILWMIINEPAYIHTNSDTKIWSRWHSREVPYSYTGLPYLYDVHAKFTHRGFTWGNWAVINCI